jgi:hypothetical protein
MTTITKVLIPAKVAETTEMTDYTAANCKAAIDKFTATNTGAANATLTVHIVTAGGTVAGAHTVSKTIAPGVTWPFPELVGHTLESGDAISAISSAGSTISIRASGREFT